MSTAISELFLNRQFDLRNLKEFQRNVNAVKSAFKSIVKDTKHICIQEFKSNVSPGFFLMPSYIVWRKIIDHDDIFMSATLSPKRKSLMKRALKQSEKLGITYKVENPVTEEKFQQFLDFYQNFMDEMQYEKFLTADYFQEKDPTRMFLINIFDKNQDYLGGRLIYRYDKKLSTEYRAIQRTKLIQEGYDIVCEKIYYDIAVSHKIKILGRGKEINLRGIDNRKIGMLFNKLKYGYKPYLLRQIPRAYMDLNFLKELDFNIVFFVSLDQTSPIKTHKEEKLIYNFVIGNLENKHLLEEVMSLKKRLQADVRIYDKSFHPFAESFVDKSSDGL